MTLFGYMTPLGVKNQIGVSIRHPLSVLGLFYNGSLRPIRQFC